MCGLVRLHSYQDTLRSPSGMREFLEHYDHFRIISVVLSAYVTNLPITRRHSWSLHLPAFLDDLPLLTEPSSQYWLKRHL